MNKSDSISINSQRSGSFFLNNPRPLYLCLIAMLLGVSSTALSQELSTNKSNDILIHGVVLSVDGKPVADATVTLIRKDGSGSETQISDAKGDFVFSVEEEKPYSLIAEKLDKHSSTIALEPGGLEAITKVELVVNQEGNSVQAASASKPSLGAMQFADQPNFTVAGVTDFTAAGGHGSDSVLRTSEALAAEASNLKPDGTRKNGPHAGSSDSEDRLKTALARDPESFDANHRLGEFYLQAGNYPGAVPLLQRAYGIDRENRANEYDLALACKAIGDPAHSKKYVEELLTHQESADLYRLAGELDESLGDSLAAVREYQKAASLDPSEQNFFAWGSELLVHRAIWQAQQVFEQGVKQYPTSSRMLTGLGTALFSGAAYDEAALRLCQASDLKPADPEPYIFLGKVQMAAPNRLACIEERLHRFVREQPGRAEANYLYAMALQRREDYAANPENKKRSEDLLRTAVAIDPKYGDAYLQLGILCASQKDFAQAIDFYTKAIAANPQMSDAYYRRAVAYDRTGQSSKARDEFALHDTIAKQQAAETERQRQEVKQFLVVLPPEKPQPQTP